jgi:hypothetical protein
LYLVLFLFAVFPSGKTYFIRRIFMKKKFAIGLIALLVSVSFIFLGCGDSDSGSETGGSVYTVTYNGNGSTGGTVPVDNTGYAPAATVTVLGKGNITRTGYTLAGWNTAANGTGTNYAAGGTFTITTNTILYAKWTAPDTTPPIPGTISTSTGVSAIGFTANWTAASDNISTAGNLVYTVYYKPTTDFADNAVATIEAGTAANTGGNAGITSLAITGLTSSTTYFFAVIVEDEAGNKAAYTKSSTTTS